MKSRKRKIFSAFVLILATCIGTLSFAWFKIDTVHEADREDIEVMAPYFLYLLNAGDTDSLQFAVGNLHPGETKRAFICVSNKKPSDVDGSYIDIARDSDFEYELEFIRTNNLDLDYTLYEVERYDMDEYHELAADEYVSEEALGYYFKRIGDALTGTDTTAIRRKALFGDDDSPAIVNGGTYTMYSEYSNDDKMHLKYNNSEYDYNFYMIEMKWRPGAVFADNKKETDMLYVVVNAMQPKPELDTTIVETTTE